ncbi:MAG: hypothetical protein AB7T08_15555 [Hyphomonadaceae bacterium]
MFHPNADQTFTVRQIEQASGGYATPAVQRNWHAQGEAVWPTRTETPPAGHGRTYSLAHVYEAAILGEGASRGISPRTMNALIGHRRRFHETNTLGRSAGWVESWSPIHELPEFLAGDVADHWLWACYLSRAAGDAGDDAGAPPRFEAAVIPFRVSKAGEIDLMRGETAVFMLDLTAIVTRVNAALGLRSLPNGEVSVAAA